jgi:pyruvate-formate lyase-activating enzyme
LENFFEGIAIDARDARAWMVAAVEVLNDASPERRDRLATVVDEILAELKAPELAPHLNWSKQGFRARWAAFAEDLDRLP